MPYNYSIYSCCYHQIQALFVDHFKLAKDAGLHLTAHAGEWTNNEEALLAAKERGVHFELCPNSNLELRTHEKYPPGHKNGLHHKEHFKMKNRILKCNGYM